MRRGMLWMFSCWLRAGAMSGAALLLGASAIPTRPAAAADTPRPVIARTEGGLVPGARVLRVTTLENDGPGSLRAALSAGGPRVVVFEVGGTITLTSRLEIESPGITVAGQTAPDPGILIRGAGLVIRTHDVRMEHVGIYPGPPQHGADARDIDALALISRAARRREVRRVVLRNLTLAHATDENLSFAGDAIGAIRLESSVIAKALQEAGHPRVQHSMGLLIYPGIEDVTVVGNIFANNDRRNPVVNSGVHGIIANNLVFGHGRGAIHLQRGTTTRDLQLAIRGNVVQPTDQTSCGIGAVQVPAQFFAQHPDGRLFLSDNHLDGRFVTRPGCVEASTLAPPVLAQLVDTPPASDPDWTIRPSAEVPQLVLRHAGARPAARNALDQRILRGVADGSGRIINAPEDDGDWPVSTETRHALSEELPSTLSGPRDIARLAAWLCAGHLRLGGLPNGDCPSP